MISRDSKQSLPLSSCCCSWVSRLRSRYGKELAEGMGFGQPLSMKLKNVQLPHPHPNGDFSLTGLLALLLCLFVDLGMNWIHILLLCVFVCLVCLSDSGSELDSSLSSSWLNRAVVEPRGREILQYASLIFDMWTYMG